MCVCQLGTQNVCLSIDMLSGRFLEGALNVLATPPVLTSRDHKAVGRRPFDKMATLLAYLGPPEHKPVADTHWSSLNLTSSKFEEFLTS